MSAVSFLSAAEQDSRNHLNRRDADRKSCKVKALLELDDHRQFVGKTIDVSPRGIALLLPATLGRGCRGRLTFCVFIDGKLETIRLAVEVCNAVFLFADIRVGFRVLECDPASKRVLTAFMR